MKQTKVTEGFSRLTRSEKISWLKENLQLDEEAIATLGTHLHQENSVQEMYEEFSENSISNFFIPFGLAPNFLINNRWYIIPMAIEESSVVAAASHAAKFWAAHGGFHAEVISMKKLGHVHFNWTGSGEELYALFRKHKKELLKSLSPLTDSMVKRGGGIAGIKFKNLTQRLRSYYQLELEFITVDAMGANFINTVLEKLAQCWIETVHTAIAENKIKGKILIDMAILSNYTPESLVRVRAETNISAFDHLDKNLNGKAFAEKFVRGTEIAEVETFRAVTHNKGIFNGIDAVTIATGNDFRAVEACGHAYASRDGKYRSLSRAGISGRNFHLELELPMAIGTVGGLTGVHPLAKTSLKILGQPSAEELMMIIATAGLANNFSAIRMLVSKGIQQGHMKMHLTNILRQLNATKKQKQNAMAFFKGKVVTFTDVKHFLNTGKV